VGCITNIAWNRRLLSEGSNFADIRRVRLADYPEECECVPGSVPGVGVVKVDMNVASFDAMRTITPDCALASALEIMARGDFNQLPVV